MQFGLETGDMASRETSEMKIRRRFSISIQVARRRRFKIVRRRFKFGRRRFKFGRRRFKFGMRAEAPYPSVEDVRDAYST